MAITGNEISESKDPPNLPRTKSKMMKQLKLMCKKIRPMEAKFLQ